MKRSVFVAGAVAAALPRAAWAAQPVDEAVRSAASGSSGVLGAYARTMSASATPVSYRADTVFPAASTIKLLILATLYAAADADPGLLSRKVPLRAADQVGGSDVLAAAPAGAKFRVSTLARAMIVQSDNTAGNTLITLLGFDAINGTANDLSLTHTQCRRHFMDFPAVWHHSDNLTTPRDMGTLLYAIERGAREGTQTVASAKGCRAMIDILLQQEDREKIAAGLPHGVPLANKTGEISGVRNDVGIVDPYGDAPYVLAVLTKNLADQSQGVVAIRKVARAVNSALGAG